MSNQPKELQPTENENSLLEQLSEKRSLVFTLQIVTGVSATMNILSIIATIVGFVFKLPEYFYVLFGLTSAISSSVFVLFGLAYYFISLRPAVKKANSLEEAKNKTNDLSILPRESEEEKVIASLRESQKTEIENLGLANQKEIESLNEKHQKEIVDLKDAHYKVIRQRQIDDIPFNEAHETMLKTITESKWLFALAKEQAEDIRQCVILERIGYSDHDFTGHPITNIVFYIQILNKSVYDVTLEKTIGGEVTFRKTPLRAEKQFTSRPIIKPTRSETFRIEQRLTQTEVEAINKAIQKRRDKSNIDVPVLDFSGLVLNIKAVKDGADFTDVEPKPLRITSSDTFDLEKNC